MKAVNANYQVIKSFVNAAMYIMIISLIVVLLQLMGMRLELGYTCWVAIPLARDRNKELE